LHTIEKNTSQLFSSLDSVCKIPSPWIFLCLAAVIDYLSFAAYPDVKDAWKRYPKFIGKFYPASYRDFKYLSGKQDLPKQMYHVLRNGLVHSFSLVPDTKGKKWSRPRSIVLAHRVNAHGKTHLSPYNKQPAPDAAYFVAEDVILRGNIATSSQQYRSTRSQQCMASRLRQ
jgi:hypothetical protein